MKLPESVSYPFLRPKQGVRFTFHTGSKAALDQFVRYVALELAPHGITANLVAPAMVEGTRVTEQLTTERMRSSPRPRRCDGWSVPTMSPRRWRSWQVRIPVSPPATTFRSTGALQWTERNDRERTVRD